MNFKQIKQIFNDTDFVHRSGTHEELQVAEYLKHKCDELGVQSTIESFDVDMASINSVHLYADNIEIPCKACFCCGSGDVEGDFYYMPATDPVSIAGAKNKIVLLDAGGINYYTYQDLVNAGALALIFRYGDANYSNEDIDDKYLRSTVVGDAKKLLSATINVKEASKLVKRNTKRIRLCIDQREYIGQSQNVIADIPGKKEELIILTAHYDTTSLSHGAYDNMSGCVGLLCLLQKFSKFTPNYSIRMIFCGSEERGLLGSKHYVSSHADDIVNSVLNINLDMIGTTLGKFICVVSAEDKLVNYLSYLSYELGFPLSVKAGVYSSDSTPFADAGVPSLSFARIAGNSVAPIHCRYDLKHVLSVKQLTDDIDFIYAFCNRMANSVLCPVSKNIPDNIKKELDEYLFRKRKE